MSTWYDIDVDPSQLIMYFSDVRINHCELFYTISFELTSHGKWEKEKKEKTKNQFQLVRSNAIVSGEFWRRENTTWIGLSETSETRCSKRNTRRELWASGRRWCSNPTHTRIQLWRGSPWWVYITTSRDRIYIPCVRLGKRTNLQNYLSVTFFLIGFIYYKSSRDVGKNVIQF